MSAPDPTTADALIRALDLSPHPEGGHYKETYRHQPGDGTRGAGTAIYFLLRRGERSAWHRVDADEIWHFHAGAAVELRIFDGTGRVTTHLLGADVLGGERPQVLVPARAWQTAMSLGEFSLVGATVTPAFEFSGFELAAPDWDPEARR